MDVGSKLNYDTFAVITSDIGLDECSTVGDSMVHIRRGNDHSELVIHPEDYGFHHTLDDISVSADALAVDNAAIFKEILSTKNTKHPIAQLIALNAAVMMHVVDAKSLQKPLMQLNQFSIKAQKYHHYNCSYYFDLD